MSRRAARRCGADSNAQTEALFDAGVAMSACRSDPNSWPPEHRVDAQAVSSRDHVESRCAAAGHQRPPVPVNSPFEAGSRRLAASDRIAHERAAERSRSAASDDRRRRRAHYVDSISITARSRRRDLDPILPFRSAMKRQARSVRLSLGVALDLEARGALLGVERAVSKTGPAMIELSGCGSVRHDGENRLRGCSRRACAIAAQARPARGVIAAAGAARPPDPGSPRRLARRRARADRQRAQQDVLALSGTPAPSEGPSRAARRRLVILSHAAQVLFGHAIMSALCRREPLWQPVVQSCQRIARDEAADRRLDAGSAQ